MEVLAKFDHSGQFVLEREQFIEGLEEIGIEAPRKILDTLFEQWKDTEEEVLPLTELASLLKRAAARGVSARRIDIGRSTRTCQSDRMRSTTRSYWGRDGVRSS